MEKTPLDLIREAQAEIEKITPEDIKSLSLEEAQQFKKLTGHILFQIAQIEEKVKSK